MENVKTETAKNNTEDLLEKMGFTLAASKIKTLKEKRKKLMIAYENYRYVRQEKIDAFNAKLKKETLKGREPYDATWKELSFTSPAYYESAPPKSVLESMQTAVERKCFDKFEIAYIRDVKDPILFGRIEGCSDRFFIDQWDDDVKISDILKENEG